MRYLLLFLFCFKVSNTYLKAQEMNADQLYNHCKDYVLWIDNKFKMPVDEKILFNMGKCQGVMETLGKTMLTLCFERNRNLNISKQFTANLENLKTLNIIREFVKFSQKQTNIRNYSAQNFATIFISNKWPCNR